MKDYAAYAFTEGMVWKDMIESVEHQFDGVTVIPLVREMAW